MHETTTGELHAESDPAAEMRTWLAIAAVVGVVTLVLAVAKSWRQKLTKTVLFLAGLESAEELWKMVVESNETANAKDGSGDRAATLGFRVLSVTSMLLVRTCRPSPSLHALDSIFSRSHETARAPIIHHRFHRASSDS